MRARSRAESPATAADPCHLLVDWTAEDISRGSRLTVKKKKTQTWLALILVAFGLVPVAQTWRLDVHRAHAAHSGRGASAGPARGRVRSVLVVAEVALAVVLAVGAALMVRSVMRPRMGELATFRDLAYCLAGQAPRPPIQPTA